MNKYKLRSRRSNPMSISKDTILIFPQLSGFGLIQPFTQGWAAGSEGQFGELSKLVQRMSSSHEGEKLCVADQPPLLCETKSSLYPLLRVHFRNIVLLMLCTYPLGICMALISSFGHLLLFVWWFSLTSRHDVPIGMAEWNAEDFLLLEAVTSQ